MNILFIAPHLSTGGLPQYLTKKVELLSSTCNVFVIEYDDITGGVFVVQWNRLKELLGDNLITLGDNKHSLLTHIGEINPDIIHMEELPEYFMDREVANIIYNPNRTYKIFETCHDSSFNCDNKRFMPDKFILVSQYQVEMLSPLNIPSEVVEYPIVYQDRPDRTEALIKLGFDPTYKHVLHVGLFTPRKNQKEFFELAKEFENEKIMFHSVGNMAGNFKDYWEPLIKNNPNNVIVHGERSDVADFYAAMDLFLFTSKGTGNDKETMPLVIREAISWKIPTLIYNLDVYENYFDKFDTIKYLNFTNKNENISLIRDVIGVKSKSVVIISTYPRNWHETNLTDQAMRVAQQNGYKVILATHRPLKTYLQEQADYILYDKQNILTHHDYYGHAWFTTDKYKAEINLKTENNNQYHGAAVYSNYYNAIALANSLGYTNAICFNFDMVLNSDVLSNLDERLNTKKGVFNFEIAEEGNTLKTVLFAINTKFFLDNFNRINSAEDYNNWQKIVGSESNGLENIFFHTLKGQMPNLSLINDEQYKELLKDCNIDISSQVEYFTVLSVKDNPNEFAIWFNSSNKMDERNVEISYKQTGYSWMPDKFTIRNETRYYKCIPFVPGDSYRVTLRIDDLAERVIVVDDDYFNNKLKENGTLTIF